MNDKQFIRILLDLRREVKAVERRLVSAIRMAQEDLSKSDKRLARAIEAHGKGEYISEEEMEEAIQRGFVRRSDAAITDEGAKFVQEHI